jgi:hypothetical protein
MIFLLLAYRKEHQVPKGKISTVEGREKEKSAFSVSLLFHHHVENTSGLDVRGRKPAPIKWQESPSFCLFVVMDNSCSIYSGPAFRSIISVRIKKSTFVHSL